MTTEPNLEPALAALRKAHAAIRSTRTSDLFRADPARFDRFSFRLDDLLIDFSKCKLTSEILRLLVDLAEKADVPAQRAAMFSGEAINNTENRAVLHTALRDFSEAPVLVDGMDVKPEIAAMRARCYDFADKAHWGHLTGATGERIDTFVCIGIGGSDLGPAMAVQALWRCYDANQGPVDVRFVSNIDGSQLEDIFEIVDPRRTMVIVASKTFTTIETMTNARAARAWIVESLGEAAVTHHFAAISTALDKVADFGIAPDRVFGFWDWVGGRYSIWSAIGLPVMIQFGSQNFQRFLEGAEAMDRHFREAALGENLPVLLALVGIWHRNVCGYPSRAVIPYDQRLARFPAYLQQLDMESNGKSVRKDCSPVAGATGPIVWGEPGTNSQHAFFQLLHQGTDVIPVEFLLAAEGTTYPYLDKHHPLLVANCLAQSQALMLGRTLAEAGGNPHRVFAGDRPSLTILYRKLDPFTLGRLIALYEHRVFVEAAIWGINAFDQWGVELGKELATRLELPVTTGQGLDGLDSSTAGLIRRLRGE